MVDLETGRPVGTYRHDRLRQSASPSIDPYEDNATDRDSEMRNLDLAAFVTGTVMALGPLSVFTIFGS